MTFYRAIFAAVVVTLSTIGIANAQYGPPNYDDQGARRCGYKWIAGQWRWGCDRIVPSYRSRGNYERDEWDRVRRNMQRWHQQYNDW
jgi:hypothetical protein